MTDMPQMIALYNGMGGGAAAAISAVELLGGGEHSLVFMVLAVLGGFIGSISFSGSMIAFAKLQGLIRRDFRFKGQNYVNLAILAVIAWLGIERLRDGHATTLGGASGVVAGLVAITPAAGFVGGLSPIIFGAVASVAWTEFWAEFSGSTLIRRWSKRWWPKWRC